MSLKVEPIGFIQTPFKEKFAVPRQPGLVKNAQGKIVLSSRYNDANCLRGIEEFSHLWLIFSFHHTAEQGWRPLVRPPRLGGNTKVGVFASRSTFRPNGIGMSVVELLDVSHNKGEILVGGIDLIDQTPILDIKPYLAYSDAIIDAKGGYANSSPDKTMKVLFSTEAKKQLESLENELEALIIEVLAQDPRPAYQRDQTTSRRYGVRLHDYDVNWQVDDNVTLVVSITKAN